MRLDILFGLIFLSQILLISYYLPGKLLKRIRAVFTNYPPEVYPRLYPKPISYYEMGMLRFKYMNGLILLIGMALLVVFLGDSTNDDWGGVVFGYFMIQFIPMALVEIYSFKYLKLLRENDSRSTRTANLQPRRLSDVLSPGLVGLAVIVYVAFIVLVVYVNQFGYPWFGGYANIAGITFANLLFTGIVLWNFYGERKNPYQASEDRMNQIKLLVKQVALISIAATLFVALNIFLKVFDLHHLNQIALSLYFQLIALFSFQGFFMDTINADVYKEKPLVT
ncbi:MAG: hypothetical protein ACRBF0_16850 [Calditrichia bacterium]